MIIGSQCRRYVARVSYVQLNRAFQAALCSIVRLVLRSCAFVSQTVENIPADSKNIGVRIPAAYNFSEPVINPKVFGCMLLGGAGLKPPSHIPVSGGGPVGLQNPVQDPRRCPG